MDGESFEAVGQRVAVAASRRGVLRAGVGGLAGVTLAGVGLVRLGADAGARGKRCCRRQRRRYRRRQQECEEGGGVLITPFSCDRATCDPDVKPEWVCEVPIPR
jgi:hypothetical protein